MNKTFKKFIAVGLIALVIGIGIEIIQIDNNFKVNSVAEDIPNTWNLKI